MDLILQKAPDKELWVTVKGFPQKSQYVQAHHWFAGAIFDLVAYRNAHARLYLAMALPDGYATYAGLAEKAAWLRRTMPFTLIWVSESGSVRSE